MDDKDVKQPEEPKVPAAAKVTSPNKDRVLWARINKKAYVRLDPGAKPALHPKGTEIQILESQISKKYMVDITAEMKVREATAEKRRKAIAKAEAELASDE